VSKIKGKIENSDVPQVVHGFIGNDGFGRPQTLCGAKPDGRPFRSVNVMIMFAEVTCPQCRCPPTTKEEQS
jgi:hypothetical protein